MGRPDGKRLKNLGVEYLVGAHVMAERTDAMNMITIDLPEAPMKEYLNNPKGFAYNRKIMMKYPVSTKRLVIETIHYVSSSIIAKNKHFVSESPRKILTVLSIPLGSILSIYIIRKAKES